MDSEKKDFGKWWMWVLGLVVVSSVVFGGLRAAGLIGGTILEREVFTRSFQYQEARKTAVAAYEAQLREIEIKLSSPATDPSTRNNLEAQAAAIRVQLNTERSKQ